VDVDKERLEKLLQIADIIEKYEYYLLRRATGNLYVGIISIVATCMFLYLGVSITFGQSFLVALFISILCFSLIISYTNATFKFRMITRIPQKSEYGYIWGAVYTVFVLLYLLKYALGINLPENVFPISLAIINGVGNVGCYLVSKKSEKYPGIIMREYLALGLVFVLTGILISFISNVDLQWLIDVIVLWIGMIIFGTYVSSTAHKVFEREQ